MKQQATAPCGCPIRHNSSCAARPKFISAWFMRDNHTFAPIKDRIDQAGGVQAVSVIPDPDPNYGDYILNPPTEGKG